jgi:phosphopantothenate---cysteine ligase (CTP)
MNILVTAGNTQAPIDRVRCVTNIFTGKTGTSIARTAWERGHTVTLLTSHPELLTDLPDPGSLSERRLTVLPYKTFDDLAGMMQQHTRLQVHDVLIHSAAVSDYLAAGVYSPEPGTFFATRGRTWEGVDGPPALVEHKSGKIKSTEPELWLRLVRAPKLIDRVRPQWGFKGVLVKFKLEVGTPDQELLELAENSRMQSGADLIVANTLEGAKHWAILGPVNGRYERIARRELAERLLLQIEDMRRTARGTWHDG